jgi:hypothetical protein
MATKLKLFTASGAENFGKLEQQSKQLARRRGRAYLAREQSDCDLPDRAGTRQAVVIPCGT